jgi:glycine cleavage system H protein
MDPKSLRYSKDHEWVYLDGDIATVGITKFAVDQLGEIVMIELPAVGDKFDSTEPFGTAESVKAVSELYAPVSGEVVEVHDAVHDDPEDVSNDPYGEGWLIKLRIAGKALPSDLMDFDAYQRYVAEGAG